MLYLIIGGGIAGVNCAVEILRNDQNPETRAILVSASSHVKTVTNWHKIGQFTETFEVKETEETNEITSDSRLELIYDVVEDWDSDKKIVFTKIHRQISYDKLCIATGATPICPWKHISHRIKCIRDTDTALDFQKQLSTSKHLVIVGNGGIATELIYELKNIKITWIIRDSSISSSFFPAEVEQFLLPKVLEGRKTGSKNESILKRQKYTITEDYVISPSTSGVALGPDWCTALSMLGNSESREIDLRNRSEVVNIIELDVSKLEVEIHNISTKKNDKIPCDMIVWATGVVPNSEIWAKNKNLKIAENRGIVVNDIFETSIPDVFACGDVCKVEIPQERSSNLWKQMYLWTQARQTAELCARSMLTGEESRMFGIYLELFAHCTTFYGWKVVFLGDYKPERQTNGNCKVVERIIGDSEYVRCVLIDHRMVGALLIGDTHLEETMENMIMNQTNLEDVEDTFLEPDVEIDDYFD